MAEKYGPNTRAMNLRLLKAYWESSPIGITTEQAAIAAGLAHRGYWKRCSDLLRDGYIQKIVVLEMDVTKARSSGRQGYTCVITDAGIDWLITEDLL